MRAKCVEALFPKPEEETEDEEAMRRAGAAFVADGIAALWRLAGGGQ